VPAALGSQTAGSIVRPASYCGVIGFKPTHGALPLQGIHPLAPSLDTLGFFVSAIEDVPVLFSALSGGPSVAIRTSKPRLGLCRTEAWPRAETETRKAIEDAARALGAREVELGPAFQGLIDAQISIMGHEASRALAGEPETELSPKLRELLREGAKVTPERLRAARDQADRCRPQLDEIFATFDALLTPAATGEAPIGLAATGDPLFCRIWTLLGAPCVSLPVLKGPAGLPVGLQVVGGRNREDVLLSACAWMLAAPLP